ncbi:MAG: queuosine salvage family protein [Candidatus Rifleibacteriota bacterium]
MSTFEKIRQSCRSASLEACHVKINSDFLNEYFIQLSSSLPDTLSMDEQNHFCGDNDKTVNYFVVLDCINFGSGFFDHLACDPGKTGYFTIASRLKKDFLKHGEFSCDYLSALTAADCCRIFAQNGNDPTVAELMQMFSQALNELGTYVKMNFNGSFTQMLESAEHSAEKLLQILTGMKYYQDTAIHFGKPVYFYKRAQITASDLNIALKGQGPGFFKDIDRLTIFADNLVPHVLWRDKAISYSDELERKIRSGESLDAGSDYEIELRAAAVHTVELLVKIGKQQFPDITSQKLDFILWNRGQAEYYRTIPPHKTRTFFY